MNVLKSNGYEHLSSDTNSSWSSWLNAYSFRLISLFPLWVFIFFTQTYLNFSSYQYIKDTEFTHSSYRLLFFPIFHASLVSILLALISYKSLRWCGILFTSMLYFGFFIVEFYLLQSSSALY